MCGITGIISKNRIDKNIIETMTDKLIHRGPDGFGYYHGENFSFGHRRLAIVDISRAGHQPMEYLDRYVITYNGEVYNHVELRKELEAMGYKFKSHTDTEVIMASYDAWGVKCLNRFNGMWAFVIYDKEKNRYFMSRDRFGKKPFYYYKDKDSFVFASEIKSILSAVKTAPNFSFLNDYIHYGCKEYIKKTAFENIYRFDFASYFEGSIDEILSSFAMKKFWRLKPNLSVERFDEEKLKEYAKKYYELLQDAVRIRLRADVKVGSALSGGLDSSSIVYLVNKLLKDEGKEGLQETFSSVYKSAETKHCDESEFIDTVASYLNVNSNQIEPIEKDVPKEHSKMIWYMENPPESSGMSAWHTFKLVKTTDVKVTLDGQGADEQLGGYFDYLTSYISSLPLRDSIKESIKYFKIPNSKAYIKKGLLISIFRNIFGIKITQNIIKKVLKKDFEINLNQKLADDTNSNLITLIHYSDHLSMAHSIESRMPFMDYRLVEFLASIPACYKMRDGWTKYIARVAFNGRLPDEITWRRDKMGWPIPEDKWYRGNLKDWFVQKVESSSLVKELSPNLNIKQELDKGTNIVKLIRYLNIARFGNLFFKKYD